MCDAVSKSNGGCCGECCSLPATATGLYKWLSWNGILMAAASVLYVMALVTDNYLLNQVADLFTVASFICWWCIARIVWCKACCEAWMLPLKRCFRYTIVAVIVCQVLVLLGVVVSSVAVLYANGTTEAYSSMKTMRLIRVVPLLLMPCWGAIFFQTRKAALATLDTGKQLLEA